MIFFSTDSKMISVDITERIFTSWPSIISFTFIGFVITLLIAKLYIKIRSRFKVLVNCWFCNQNTRVQYEDYNSWNCPHCGQYNGFTKDGDYNREISSQTLSGNLQFGRRCNTSNEGRSPGNGFCQTCNDNQMSKVEALAAFEPQNESKYAEELGHFRQKLEETFRLCHRCEKNLSKTLADKKKMILGLRLAQEGITRAEPPRKQLFKKSSHIQTPTSIKLFQRCTNAALFILAIANWVNIIGPLKLSRENLAIKFGPTIAKILLIIISHLAALTKVIVHYLSALLNIHIVEKTILFLRTMSIIGAHIVGLNLYMEAINFNALFQHGIAFASMFLTFGAHFWDGFKVTKKTYLLTIWSAYTCLVGGDFSKEYDVYKVLVSLIIVLLSLPTFSRKNELHQILDNTVSSFHRLQSDDYLTEEPSTIMNSTAHLVNRSKDTSHSSSSSNSFSPILLNHSCHSDSGRTLLLTTSPVTPVSAFKSYSSDHLHLNDNSPYASSHFAFSPAPKSVSMNTMNTNFPHTQQCASPHIYNGSLYKSFGCSTPRSYISAAASFAPRRNLLSPSHFTCMNSTIDSNAYVKPPQSPCSTVNGDMYSNNFNDKLETRKHFFLNNVVPHENVSRGSSQSSGFESLAGSAVHNFGEKICSRENSICPSDDYLSAYSEMPPTSLSHDMHNKSYGMRSMSQFSRGANKRNLFLPKTMNFETGDHWIRNSPMDRRQTFKTDYLAKMTANYSSSNAFDLNGMNSYLPPIRKRYNLFRSVTDPIEVECPENLCRTNI